MESSYAQYSKDVKRRTKHNPFSFEYVYSKLPRSIFDIFYADPPWDYNGKLQYDRSKLFVSAARFKYPTMKTEEMMKIPIQNIAAEDSLLFMWVTSPHLAQAIQLGESWDFKYRTVAFVWDKMNHNPGKYTMSSCEMGLVFKRGRIPMPRGARNIKQMVRIPRGKHSEKPVEVMQAIQKMFPTQRRIEIFANKKYRGWSRWGLQQLLSKSR